MKATSNFMQITRIFFGSQRFITKNQVQTTQYGLRSLCFSGAKLWSSLPLDIKQITSFSRFRQNVINSMIDRYNKDTDNYFI